MHGDAKAEFKTQLWSVASLELYILTTINKKYSKYSDSDRLNEEPFCEPFILLSLIAGESVNKNS